MPRNDVKDEGEVQPNVSNETFQGVKNKSISVSTFVKIVIASFTICALGYLIVWYTPIIILKGTTNNRAITPKEKVFAITDDGIFATGEILSDSYHFRMKTSLKQIKALSQKSLNKWRVVIFDDSESVNYKGGWPPPVTVNYASEPLNASTLNSLWPTDLGDLEFSKCQIIPGLIPYGAHFKEH